jgi:hypothetical protein
MEELQQSLLQRQRTEQQLQNLGAIQQQGDIGGAIASIGAFRARRRLAQQDERIADLSEQRRKQLISTLDPAQQQQAGQLSLPDLQTALFERTKLAAKPSARKTIKDVSGRQRFVDSGELVFPDVKTPTEQSIQIPAEATESRDFRTVEQVAQQNLLSGNKTVAKQQFALANRLRKEDELIQKDTLKISERLDKADIGGLINSIERLAGFANSTKDIAGVGKTGVVPNILLSPQGRETRQSAITFANQLVKAQSGLQINESEAGRIFGELGLERNLATGGFKIIPGTTDDQLRTGLRNAISRIAPKIKNIQAGARPEAVQRYNERLGSNPLESLQSIEVRSFDENNLSDVSDEELLKGF